MSSLSEKIIYALKKNGEIEEGDQALLTYGLTQGIRMCMNILTTLLIGLWMGMWWQGLLFLAAFIPIRSFAGGFHAKTPLRCYWYSVGIIIVSLTVIRYGRNLQFFLNGAVILSVAAIFCMAPVESGKKLLSDSERKIFKKKVRLSLGAALTCIAVLYVSGLYEASNCIKMAVTVVGLLVVTGGFKIFHDKHIRMAQG